MKERNKAKKVKDTLLIVYWTSGRGDIPNAVEDSATCTCKFSTSSLVLKSLPTLRFSYVICISSFILQHFLRIKKKKRLESCGIYRKVERGISISVSKESDHRRLQQSNLTPIEQFFHSCLFPTAKMATGFYQEASLLILNAEFERNG